MDCPVCRAPMIVIERSKVELDFCIQCEGTWFDHEELALLGGEAYLSRAASADETEATRNCPRCPMKTPMEKLRLAEDILIDRCAVGHGLWFDHGETEAVAKLAEAPDSVLAFMAEVLPAEG